MLVPDYIRSLLGYCRVSLKKREWSDRSEERKFNKMGYNCSGYTDIGSHFIQAVL